MWTLFLQAFFGFHVCYLNGIAQYLENAPFSNQICNRNHYQLSLLLILAVTKFTSIKWFWVPIRNLLKYLFSTYALNQCLTVTSMNIFLWLASDSVFETVYRTLCSRCSSFIHLKLLYSTHEQHGPTFTEYFH